MRTFTQYFQQIYRIYRTKNLQKLQNYPQIIPKMHHYLLQEEQQVVQQLQLSIKCLDLVNQAQGMALDSFIVVKLIEKNKPIKQLVKSKVYWSCSNPDYEEKFKLEFCFKNEQNLLLQVFAHDTTPKLYGWVETTVSKIFGCRDKIFESYLKIPCKNSKTDKKFSTSKMQILCKKKQKSVQELMCLKLKVDSYQIQALRKMYFFVQKAPYFFTISKTNKNTETILYKSQQMQNFSRGQFKQFQIRKKLFQENYSEFQLKVYQGSHQAEKFIGSFAFTPLDLQIKRPQKFALKKAGSTNIGFFTIQLIDQFKKYTFADYLDAGLQFKLICNIDFTASNKKISEFQSLHRISGGVLSAYEEAMSETLKILLDYDEDKLIPTYGFGAKVQLPNYSSEGKVSHCFPLNGDEKNPNLKQLSGVTSTYRNALRYLEFAGPTNFFQIIQNAISQCYTFCSDLSQYMIIFILTDGQMHDLDAVVDLIDKNSHLPLSIIILGLGQNDFSQMVKLDGDIQPLLNSRGKRVRDIVQFVDFKQCKYQSSRLAVSVLEQLPTQVLEFYSKNKITPQKMSEIKLSKEKSKNQKMIETLRNSSRKSYIDLKQLGIQKVQQKNGLKQSKFKMQKSGKVLFDLTNTN